jgi:hypothetical protein
MEMRGKVFEGEEEKVGENLTCREQQAKESGG